MEALGKIFFSIIIMFLASIIGGYVFMKLWHWFVVSTFNIQNISLIQSIGLMLVTGYIKSNISKEKSEEDDDEFALRFIKKFLFLLIFSLFTLGIGWVIYQFI